MPLGMSAKVPKSATKKRWLTLTISSHYPNCFQLNTRRTTNRAMKRNPKLEREVVRAAMAARETDGCLLWEGKVNPRGYGYISFMGKNRVIHRLVLEMLGRPIPKGMVTDHICRNRLCINPAHLRAVTPKQNTLENSLAPTAINAMKTHCISGHRLSGTNLIERAHGWRGCRECQRKYDRAYKARLAKLRERG